KTRIFVTTTTAKIFCTGIFLFVLCLTFLSYMYNFHWNQSTFPVYAAVVLHFLPFALVVIFNSLAYIAVRINLSGKASYILNSDLGQMLYQVRSQSSSN